MKHLSPSRLNGQISEEAAEWFIRFRTGDIDIEGRRAFDVWLRSSQENLRAYLEIAAIWNEGGSLDTRRQVNIDALVSRAQAEQIVVPLDGGIPDLASTGKGARPRANEEAGGGARPAGTKVPRLVFAASTTFLALAAAIALWLHASAAVYETGVGEQRSVRLADGSLVTLNSRSKVQVNFSEHERAVELLEGQALFEVAKNPARSFIVRSDDASIRAVGTQFDVYKKSGRTIVTVLEGKVAVVAALDDAKSESARSPDSRLWPTGARSQAAASSPGESITASDDAVLLSAGEQVTVSALAVPRPVRVDIEAKTAWTKRQLVLESVPLIEVAEEFSRYSDRRLIVEGPASGELRLSGVFATDPDFLISYLRERPDITVQETSTEIRIVQHD